jgi:hypothetical protein
MASTDNMPFSLNFRNCIQPQLAGYHSKSSEHTKPDRYLHDYHRDSKSQSFLTTDGPGFRPRSVTPRIFLFHLLGNSILIVGDRYFGVTSLSRRKFYTLRLLLSLASVVFVGSDSRGNHDYILRSQFTGYPNLEYQTPVPFSPRNRVAYL